MSILILGAGLSGLSVAARLKEGYEIVEKERECGGLCRTYSRGGFVFDRAAHVLHFKDKDNLGQVRELLGRNLARHDRDSRVWAEGAFIPYPFQHHFYYLDPKTEAVCLQGFLDAQKRKKSVGGDLRSWLLGTFGVGIARHFLIPYNEKFWRYPLGRLLPDAVRRHIPVPHVRDLRRRIPSAAGYNAEFWYPRHGGIQALVRALEKRVKRVKTSFTLTCLDLDEKAAYFSNGQKIAFRKAVSTIPLPELGRVVRPLPKEVKRAFSKLKHISVYNLNIGLSRPVPALGHWAYFAQKDISFYRVAVSSNIEPNVSPLGCASLSFEVSHMPGASRPGFVAERMTERILADCRAFGLGIDRRDIRVCDASDIAYGYCVYDKERQGALKVIAEYLKKHGVFLAGRYGAWQYASMEDVMVEAAQVAAKIKRQP